jgi:hypothetical protein
MKPVLTALGVAEHRERCLIRSPAVLGDNGEELTGVYMFDDTGHMIAMMESGTYKPHDLRWATEPYTFYSPTANFAPFGPMHAARRGLLQKLNVLGLESGCPFHGPVEEEEDVDGEQEPNGVEPLDVTKWLGGTE